MHLDENKPKRGAVIISLICLIGVPLVLYIVFRRAIFRWQPRFSKELNEASAKVLGFGCGSIFHAMCFISNIFKETKAMVKKRIVDFKENLPISFKFAVTCYLQDVKDDGIDFLIQMSIVITCLIITISNLSIVVKLLA